MSGIQLSKWLPSWDRAAASATAACWAGAPLDRRGEACATILEADTSNCVRRNHLDRNHTQHNGLSYAFTLRKRLTEPRSAPRACIPRSIGSIAAARRSCATAPYSNVQERDNCAIETRPTTRASAAVEARWKNCQNS